MSRYFPTLLLTVLALALSAQTGVDIDPPTDPDPGAAESPILWILLAVVLLGGLLYLRSRTRRVGKR